MDHRIIQIGLYEFAVESETRYGKVKGKRVVGGFGSEREAQAWMEQQFASPQPGEMAAQPAVLATAR